MSQTMKLDKTPEELSEIEIGSLTEIEFRIMFVKMIKELRRRINEQSQKSDVFLTKRSYKEKTERKNTITEMPNIWK